MAVRPFLLWRPVEAGAVGTAGPESPLPVRLAEVAPIYRALAGEGFDGFSPREVDEMELWEIAELLGINDPADAGAPVSVEQFQAQSQALLAERVRRAESGLAPPRPPPSAGPAITPAMIAALQERRRAKRKG